MNILNCLDDYLSIISGQGSTNPGEILPAEIQTFLNCPAIVGARPDFDRIIESKDRYDVAKELHVPSLAIHYDLTRPEAEVLHALLTLYGWTPDS